MPRYSYTKDPTVNSRSNKPSLTSLTAPTPAGLPVWGPRVGYCPKRARIAFAVNDACAAVSALASA